MNSRYYRGAIARLLAVLVLAFAVAIPFSFAQETRLSGSFFVQNTSAPKPDPMAGITVYLYGEALKAWSKPIYTDSLGRFSFMSLDPGTYYIRALNANGAKIWEQMLVIKAGATTLGPITLRRTALTDRP